MPEISLITAFHALSEPRRQIHSHEDYLFAISVTFRQNISDCRFLIVFTEGPFISTFQLSAIFARLRLYELSQEGWPVIFSLPAVRY
jgi:hypothetical protein